MKKLRILGAVCACMLHLLIPSLSNAATVGFSNNLLTVAQGSSFLLTIQGTGFDPIAGGGLNMSFDASVLQVDSVTINESVFDFFADTGLLDNTTGSLLDTQFGSFFGASGNFDIMTIGFTAGGTGSSNLVLSESVGLGGFTDALGGYYGDQVSFSSATVNVSAVPVPAAAWLFGSGLIGLIGVARRKKA